MKRPLLILSVAILVAAMAALRAEAKVVRIEVLSRTDLGGGKEFGLAGPYEQLTGRVYFAVDPNDPHNRRIVDIDKAPRNSAGMVEFSSDLVIMRPKDANRGNGSALVEISNRGGRGMVRFYDHARGDDELGDGFLMRNGFTLVWVGWEFDVANGLTLHAPVATDNGGAISGWIRSDFVFQAKTFDASLGHRGQQAQMAVDPESTDYKLTVRDSVAGDRHLLPRINWQFGRLVDGVFTRDSRFIYLKTGFESGRIYEVVYRTSNPTVVGLGLAAVRDLVSCFKYEKNDVAAVSRAIGFGISQSGRFLRHFLYQGFNADERDRAVFDGIDAHVGGGGRGSFNHRFAEPSRDASPFSTFFYPTDIFPFTDVEQTDPETGETDGLLTLTATQKVLPKIFYTNSSYEYWGRAASLIHINIDGKTDAHILDNVRIYYFPGGQHGLGQFPPVRNQSRNLVTPVDYVWAMRALLLRLNAWVKEGTAPPESRYPRIADGTLTPLSSLKFPKIPGVIPPASLHEAWRVDYGGDFKSKGLIAYEPPRIGKPFPVMVPQVDGDGIDLGGVRMPEVAVPLATFTGWNQRDPKNGAPDQLADFTGSYLPFAKAKSDRDRLNDPRPSIEERYTSREQYLGKITEAALKLVKGGYLLADDLPRIIERAEQHWEYATR
jgi:hypothetical protein